MAPRLRADLTLLGVAVIWGSAFAVQREVAITGALFIFNGLRFLLGALTIYPFVWKRHWPNRGEWRTVILAGMLLFFAAALQQAGMRTTTAANAGFFSGLYVIFTPFILWIGWKEKPGWLSLISIIIASGGTYLLSTGGVTFQLHPGDDLELLGAVFWALHVVVLAKYAPRIDVLTFSVGQFVVCGLLNLTVGALTEPISWLIVDSFAWPLLYTGLLSVGIGYTLQVWAQRSTPPVHAALILSAETVMAAFFGYLFLGEMLTTYQLAGCGLILMGIVLVQIKMVR